jgi:hypothetical protein
MDDQVTEKSVVSLIDQAIARFLAGLDKNEVKLAVADAQRLLDLRKQLAQDEIREVKVTWVESNWAPSVSNT